MGNVAHSALATTDLHVPFNAGLDAGKAGSPTVGMAYFATDTKTVYFCYTAGTWESMGSPAGIYSPFAGSTAPDGWLLCNGQAVSRTTYARLFAVLGTDWGSGDGSTTFNVPNMKGRVPVGLDASQTEFDTIAETGGEKTHTLTSAEMAAHTHSFSATTSSNGGHSGHTNASANGGSGAAINHGNASVSNHSHTVSGTSGSTGSGTAHENMPPYVATNYIIKT